MWAVPLVLAQWAAVICVRLGLFNVALDATIMAGAFAYAAVVTALFDEYRFTASNAFWTSVIAALLLGAAVGLLFGVLVERFRLEPIVAGIGLSMATIGAIECVHKYFASEWLRADTRIIGLGEKVAGLGQRGLSAWHLYAVMLVGIALLYGVFTFTWWGRRATGVGSNEGAARQSNVPIETVRILGSGMAGLACAASGIVLVLMSSYYRAGMSAGRGYIALAFALIPGTGIVRACGLAVLFGWMQSSYFDALFRDLGLSQEIVSTLPYLFMLGVLVLGCSRQSGAGKRKVTPDL
jgi:simple sugar transport system permease protein